MTWSSETHKSGHVNGKTVSILNLKKQIVAQGALVRIGMKSFMSLPCSVLLGAEEAQLVMCGQGRAGNGLFQQCPSPCCPLLIALVNPGVQNY